jgi:hypothetical protein
VGLAVVAGGLATVLYLNRGSHIELKGAIKKVRTLPVEDTGSIAIIDFHLINPGDYAFVVKRAVVTLTTQDGQKLEGTNIAEIDARRLFEYYPTLGQKFNSTLLAKERIGPKETPDRMLAVRFDVPEARIQMPKEIRIRIDDVDGAYSELSR